MTDTKPVVYIFHGDDEFAIGQALTTLESQLGDPSTAEMNTTQLDGRTLNLDELVRTTRSMPFLAERRLVALSDPLGAMKSSQEREKFRNILENVPPTTALVIQISKPLVDPRGRRSGKTHWLEKWAGKMGDKVFLREFSLPKGHQMTNWIRGKAKELEGEFSPPAAALLGSFVGDDPRLAVQEIEKLLAYVNYQRPVQPDDVEYLVADVGETSVFDMVDAMGARDGQQAQRLLHRLLEEEDPLRLFGMIVRQFRLLLLTREMLDSGHRDSEIAPALKTPPFVARKLISQARNFSLSQLEVIYHKLLDIDEAIKTGKTDGAVALDTFVVALTH
jgi:DNA polymerase-3 subunit delta